MRAKIIAREKSIKGACFKVGGFVLKHVAACGICCDVCGLHERLGCVCSSGVEKVAKEKVATQWDGKGILCLVLDCAVKHGVAYCMRDCEEFPCEKFFEWCFPY